MANEGHLQQTSLKTVDKWNVFKVPLKWFLIRYLVFGGSCRYNGSELSESCLKHQRKIIYSFYLLPCLNFCLIYEVSSITKILVLLISMLHIMKNQIQNLLQRFWEWNISSCFSWCKCLNRLQNIPQTVNLKSMKWNIIQQ